MRVASFFKSFQWTGVGLVLWLYFFSTNAYGQVGPEVKLSEKHLGKIEQLSSMKEKLKLYRRFYHKDSLVAAIQERESRLTGKATKLSKRATRKLNALLEKRNPSKKSLDTLVIKPTPDSLITARVHTIKEKTKLKFVNARFFSRKLTERIR